MTALFSTGEFYTASTALGAVAAYSPAVMAMFEDFLVLTGKTVSVGATMGISSPLRAAGGTWVSYMPSTMDMIPSLKASGGARALIDASELALTLAIGGIAAGGMAALVTDQVVQNIRSTAMQSTAGPFGAASVVRTPHNVSMSALSYVNAGARVPLDISDNIKLNKHGPVARSKGVQGQFIMS